MWLLWKIVLALLFILASAAFGQPYEEGATTGSNGNHRSSYRRSDEVEEKCNALSSGRSDRGRGSSSSSSTQDGPILKWAREKELSFQNGEWEQAAGSPPLLPFQPDSFSGSPIVGVTKSSFDPIQFASFWITHVNQKRDGKQEALQVSAVLQLAIRAYQDLDYLIGNNIEEFLFDPGSSVLTILLEGLYTESEAGRSLCMLGCTVLPHGSSNVSNPWSDLPLHPIQSPPTSRTCNLMLQLDYPTEMSLTSRAIRGVLKSLSSPGEWSYFDPIRVVSQMGADASYEFRAGGLVKEACKGATPSAEGTEISRGDHICAIVRESLNGQQLEPLFNWKCNKSEEYCAKLGPFKSKGGLPVPRNGSKILIQDVRCVELEDERSGKAANISAVFRAIPPSQDQYLVFQHMGLDGLVLVAEGMWSSGKLCMIACADGSQTDCNIRICLYMPTELSITQRSVLVGTISSLDGNDAISFDPLSFHQPVSPGFRSSILGMHYKYTKINNVGAIMKREEPLGQSEKIRSSLLKYPSTGSYYSLSEDLRVHSPIISQKSFHSPSYFGLNIIAIEKFVIDWTRASNFSTEVAVELSPQPGHVGPKEEGKFVKVAAQLVVRHPEIPETRSPVIHGEGLYNPRTGKMYLVGCKEVSAAWQVLQNNKFDLVDGLDCNVEVIVRFPPKNAALLVKPTVSITITSRRTKDDPLFSPQVSLQTSQHLYRRQRKGIVSRKSLEAGLRLVTLSIMPMCIASQLIYIRKNKDSAPFISLVMLGVQAMNYGVPLIIGGEALYAKRYFNRTRLSELGERELIQEITLSELGEGEWTQEIMFLSKLLLLVTFLLNMHLCQKVVKARIQLRTQRPLEPGGIPSERKVFLIFLLIHAMGFLLVLTMNSLYNRTSQVIVRSVEWQQHVKEQNAKWVKEILKEYGRVMQDLFLLPQVLGGALWDVEGKPLRPVYYIGLTILCMVLHACDTSRDLLFNTYDAHPTVEGNIAIPLLTLLLAFAVYVQQRWKFFRKGSSKLKQDGSNMFERLPSKFFEADLTSNIPPRVQN